MAHGQSTLLCLVGGAIGLMLAWSAVRLVVALGPVALPRLNEVRLDAVTSAFTFILSLATASGFHSADSVHANDPVDARERARERHNSGSSSRTSRVDGYRQVNCTRLPGSRTGRSCHTSAWTRLKNGGIRSDAERQGDADYGREPWATPHRTEPVTHVLRKISQPRP
jgi:hypothetical protein